MSGNGTVVVIGSGAAGSACARTLVRKGFDVALAEKDRLGGTCLWYGCIPKKALYTSARAAREMRVSEQFGVCPGRINIDWPSILAWKWHAQETWAGDQRALLEQAGIRVAEGAARFTGEDTVEIAGESVRFDHAVIATGSEPVPLPVSGADLSDTSDDALRYRDLPPSLLIVGGGFIAAEFAAIFASLGVEVSVAFRGPRLLGDLDPDLASVAAHRLDAAGVRLLPESTVEGLHRAEDERVTAALRRADRSESELQAARVLAAIGRRPRLGDLDLDSAGIAIDDGRLVLDSTGRTTNPKVYAAGDVSGAPMHTPVANFEGRRIAQAIAGECDPLAECGPVPITCFTDPELATVGLTEESAERGGIEVDVRRLPFSAIGAGVVADVRDCFVKLVASADDGRVLGMQVAAPDASDLIYTGAVAIRAGVTLEELSHTIGVHPSFGESINFAAG